MLWSKSLLEPISHIWHRMPNFTLVFGTLNLPKYNISQGILLGATNTEWHMLSLSLSHTHTHIYLYKIFILRMSNVNAK